MQAHHGESFLVCSAAHDTRWPKWGPGVADLGVHSGLRLSIAHLVSTLEEAVEGRHEIGVAQGVYDDLDPIGT